MDINVFMAQIAEQYDDVDVAILTPETAFRKVEGWTSLVALMIITMIDEEYGVVITGDEMKTATSLQEL